MWIKWNVFKIVKQTIIFFYKILILSCIFNFKFENIIRPIITLKKYQYLQLQNSLSVSSTSSSFQQIKPEPSHQYF